MDDDDGDDEDDDDDGEEDDDDNDDDGEEDDGDGEEDDDDGEEDPQKVLAEIHSSQEAKFSQASLVRISTESD